MDKFRVLLASLRGQRREQSFPWQLLSSGRNGGGHRAHRAADRGTHPRRTDPRAEIIEEETLPDLYDASVRRSTRLEAFLKGHGIKPAHLARECGYSRQHLLRIRLGCMEPTRRCMAAIVVACRRLTRRRVRASALFDLGDT